MFWTLSASSFTKSKHPMKNPGCKTATPERLTEIDGLRGWAALSVVIFHAFYVTFSSVYPVR
jgi:uncharacterized membrane protein